MRLPIPLLLIFLAACTQGGGSDTVPPEADEVSPPGDDASLVGPLWVLDSLPGTTDIAGNGGRMPDLRFADDGNAGGFSGCNSMGGPYTASRDSLRFGPMVMTMMACQDGMEVERAYAEALEKVVRFERRDATLELYDGAGLVARFRAR
ncbi:MAG TPA: META domain-containing protein [Gemmatimonadales bacterium]|nr:META domain-containing protein [Gemmatimonadales bacterium]